VLSGPEPSFTRRALLISTGLLRANRFGLLLGGLLLIAGWVLDIVPPGLAVIGSLFGIWLGARLIIGLSRWILNSPIGVAGQQPGLCRMVIFHTVIISLFSLGLALGHLAFLSQPMKELFDRSFMLLLLPPAYLALRIRNLWYGMLRERKGTTYWVRLAGLVGLAIPLAIFAAALLGIFGFINLAWALAGYLTMFFAVIIGWMIARGLVKDLAKAVEAAITRRSENAVLWVKGLIEPLQYLIRLTLFLAAAWILYHLIVDDPATGLDLRAWLDHTLFTIGETSINSIGLLSSILLLFLVFYIGHWAREVTYGWIYTNIRDLGIRNSLSVFTQYAVIVIGLLIALNILGINLTSLTVFAGALGVGIGFGLQNIANNFISGIILLAERPVRAKDWVTIGGNEGTVAEIGMRSVTVTTWDNQDVIIPNSELISNSFINWTRSDSEVRTVLYLGISYQDDPHKAQRIILDAVTMQPEVSLTPNPQVWLDDFAASSVNFRVQYYTDVLCFSRLEIRSKVLFAIWDALHEAGISIPFPQQDIYIKEMPPRQ
jgi:potassium efflux system protein